MEEQFRVGQFSVGVEEQFSVGVEEQFRVGVEVELGDNEEGVSLLLRYHGSQLTPTLVPP